MQGMLMLLQRSRAWRMMLGMCWRLLHFLIIIVHFWAHIFRSLHYFLISSGVLRKYGALPLHKLRYLAIVVDSEEAADTFKIKNLLRLLSDIGVRNIILYDMDGVLKRSESSLRNWLDSSGNGMHHQDRMSLEVLSYSDGRETMERATSFICSKYLEDDDHLIRRSGEPVLSESDLYDALRTVGCRRAEPELLLVFAPVRCHLGFPAWRMRYTEIVHMGSLKSMKHGAIVKAIYDLSKKQQNYGS